jgi:ribosomal-protein-alanine N-acetyltransferase
MDTEIRMNRLLLRPLNDGDLQNVYRQFSDPDMCRYFSEPPCTIAEAKQIISHYRYKDGDAQLRLCITDKVTGHFIGTCGFHFWDKANRRVEIGYDIWKEYWRLGYAKEAVAPLISLCFGKLAVECVCAFTHTENTASENLLRSLGFSLDGILRGWVNVNGEQQPQKCFTLLKDEWIK